MLLTLALLPQAAALSLSLATTTTVAPGIVVRKYRTSSPTTDTWVASIDLCQSGVYLDATRAPDSTQSTGSWASDAGVKLAVNGDFYRTGPVRVYGDAVGGGVAWPTIQTGRDSSYSGEWYYRDYGWIAVGHDWVDFTHTKWVKNNASDFGGATAGWMPTTVAPDPPPGTLALVSGFPELVIEGTPITCSSPTASSCFPDRSDMRDRHPRTAIGLTEDRSTLLLVVVDGRTSRSSGMYGAELADLLHQLGAWEAFNHDGGGSSQMWVRGTGYLNDIDGNNSGSGTRSVANHWGVFSGGADLPERPGHCESATPCGTVPASGATIDNSDACFRPFGDLDYWRSAAGGVNGRLRWTNAFRGSSPDNWAWWQLHLEEAGTYRVEVSVDATYSVHRAVRYDVRHGGTTETVTIDPTAASSWAVLGTWDFAAGGDQWVAVNDNVPSGSVASGQSIVADSVRLVRVDPYCGDGACNDGETCGSCAGDCPPVAEIPGNGVDDDCDGLTDPAEPEDTSAPQDTSAPRDTASSDTGQEPEDVPEPDTSEPDAPAGDTAPANVLPGEPEMLGNACGCASGGSAPLLPGLLGLAALVGRRRRR